jgi:hypothetical protein
MSHPARFTQSDLDRILKAAKKAGVDVRVKIEPDGAITVETGKMAEAHSKDSPEKIAELVRDAS